MNMRPVALLSMAILALLSFGACGSGKSSNTTNAEGTGNAGASRSAGGPMTRAGTVPNCGATQAVWVNLNTKVYHEPSDPAYGRTKHGEYLCPSQATEQGFRPVGGERHRRHHKQTGST